MWNSELICMEGVNVFFEDIREFKLKRRELYSRIKAVIRMEGKVPGPVNLIFGSDDYLLNMNQQYLKHDYFTDIITFSYNEGDAVSGDLFISVDRVGDNAVKNDQSFNRELHRVIFHGLLHLMGYDDKDDDSLKMMRSKEDFYLDKFEVV